MTEIVAARAADAPILGALHALAFSDPWKPEDIRLLLESPGVFAFSARLHRDPAGFILCRIAADEAEILTIAVAPGVQRRGLARGLMSAGLAAALAAGGQAMFLEVATDNLPAIALYRAFEFREVGRRAAYYRRPGAADAAALVMRRDLNR